MIGPAVDTKENKSIGDEEESDNLKDLIEIADNLISCQIPEDNPSLKEKVLKLQKHKHTQTCRKYGTVCRFNYPKFPSEKSLIARPRTFESKEEETKFMDKRKEVLGKALEILEDRDDYKIDEETTFEDFLELIKCKEKDYYEYISTSERGLILVSKRSVKERYINNYNREWLEAWNANLDVQFAFDTYAVLTYMVNYYGKDETGMTKLLQEALKEAKDKPFKEQLKALALCYMTHRQQGASEAIYKILPGLHLKDSNIGCVFVPSGFPERRSVMYSKVKDENVSAEDEVLDDGEDETEVENHEVHAEVVEIPGRIGKYKQNITLIEKYASRPSSLALMCLAQFATHYQSTSRLPKSVEVVEKDGMKEVKSVKTGEDAKDPVQYIYGHNDEKLPKFIKVESGFMRLRTFPLILRIHSSKKKEEHEEQYAEMLLYYPWQNEQKDIPREEKECIEKYYERIDKINENKSEIYPLLDLMENLDTNVDLEKVRPVHLADMLDPEGEQNNEEDDAIGEEVDNEFAGRDTNLVEKPNAPVKFDDAKYPTISPPDKSELLEMTRTMVPEQLRVLEKSVEYLKNVIKHRKKLQSLEALRMIVHGGAGNLRCRKCLLIHVILQSKFFFRCWKVLLNSDDSHVC